VRVDVQEATTGVRFLCLLIPALAPAIALAEQASASPAGTGRALEEIVVTAQRREEPLQQVPVAVTALNSKDLEARQLRRLQGIQYAAPNLGIWPVQANPMTATISMRGQVEPDLVPTYDSAVGLYLDGVYIARATGANLDLVDLQRVEVLRGPQGTLFGRNSIGGAISLVTNKPAPDLESTLSASVGNFDSFDATAILNVPFHASDNAVRVALEHREHDGFGFAVPIDRELSDDDTDFVRIQLRLSPADNWLVDLAYDLTSVRDSTQLVTFLGAYDDALEVPAAAGHPDDDLSRYLDTGDGRVMSNRAGGFDARVWGVAATLTGRADAVTLQSITSWRFLDLAIDDNDNDGTPYDLAATLHRDQQERQFSQELQLIGDGLEDRLHWTGGAIFFGETATLHGANIETAPPYDFANQLRGTTHNESLAAYAQVRYALTDGLHLSAGVRYNEDWRELVSANSRLRLADGVEQCLLVPEIVDPGQACRATLPGQSYGYWPYTLGLDYSPSGDLMVYGKISHGARAGGFNMRGSTSLDLLTFDPEHVIAYEIGAKSETFDHRLRIDLALFHTDYDDIQLGQFVEDPVNGDSTVIKQNAGEAYIEGGELEVAALLGGVQLSGALGLAHGRYTHIEPGVIDVQQGEQFVFPTLTYSVAVDVPVHLQSAELDLHADYAGHDDDLRLAGRCGCDNAIGLLNVTVAYRRKGSPLEFGVWARNLADTRYMAQAFDFGNLVNGFPGDPRVYGASVTWKLAGP
jgi:iron complex outermembrane receptor protein